MQYNFDRACEFMSAYISSKHAEAQHTYANRQAAGGQRPNISATGSDVDRGGRGRDDCSGQQSGQITGRSRGGCGRTNGRRARAYITTSPTPHRNFTAAEWEKLGTMRRVVLQMCKSSGRGGGRRENDNRSLTNRAAQRTVSVDSVNGSTSDENATTNDNSVVS
jgi:hypothetical protein